MGSCSWEEERSPEPNHGDHASSLFIGRENNSVARGTTMGHRLLSLVPSGGSGVMNELN
jgi:hypothetical protein